MKEIKLKKVNKMKYCPYCQKVVEIKMVELNGYCENCNTRLYSTDTRKERREK